MGLVMKISIKCLNIVVVEVMSMGCRWVVVVWWMVLSLVMFCFWSELVNFMIRMLFLVMRLMSVIRLICE